MKTIVKICLFFSSLSAVDSQIFWNQTIIEAIESVPAAHRDEILLTWNQLYQNGMVEVIGRDNEIRPQLIAIQGIVESLLASELHQSIQTVKGVIHTPLPSTPLCSKSEVSAHLFTAKARATIVRNYLFKGGDLYIVYPKSGYEKRTLEEQAIYQQELTNHPNHLFDCPLDCETIPPECIGATYIFQDAAGNSFLFAINMTQANDPQEWGSFSLWFGPLDHPAIQERIKTVMQYIGELL